MPATKNTPTVWYGEAGGVGGQLPTPKRGADRLPSGANPAAVPAAFIVMQGDEDMASEPDPQADWRVPFLNCLIREVLPADKAVARWLARRAKSFVIVEGELYRKSRTKVLQRCIPTEQGVKLLEDILGGA